MNQTEKLGPVPNLFARFTRHVEAPVPAYSGRGEVALAVLILPRLFQHMARRKLARLQQLDA